MPVVEGVRIKVEIDGDKVAIKSLDRLLQSQRGAEEGAEGLQQQSAYTSQSIERLGSYATEASSDVQRFSAVIGDSAPNSLADFRGDILRTADAVDDAGAKMQSASGRIQGLATTLSQIASDSPFGVLGIANNVEQLAVQLQGARKAGMSFKQIAASLFTPGALLTIGVGVVSALAVAFGDDLVNALFKSNEQLKSFKKGLSDVLELDAADTEEGLEAQITQLEDGLDRLEEEEERLNEVDGTMASRFMDSMGVTARQALISQGLTREQTEGVARLTEEGLSVVQAARKRREQVEEAIEITEEQILSLRGRLEALRFSDERDLPTREEGPGNAPSLSEPSAPPRPRVPFIERPTDQLQDAASPDTTPLSEVLTAMGALQLRLSKIQDATDQGILSGAEADQRRLQAAQQALQRLQRRALQGEDIDPQDVERARQEIERFTQDAGQDLESGSEDAFARGIAQGAQRGIQQGFQPLLSSIESDVAKALISAFTQALASAAAAKLAAIISGDDSQGPSEGDIVGQLFGGVLGAGLSALTGGLFAGGGYTGRGARMEPAGIVHRGEYVVPKPVVDRTGPDYWARMAGMPGYASGGFVEAVPNRSGGGTSSALIEEVRQLRSATEAALSRPAEARISRSEFREAGRETEEYNRQKNPRNIRR